MAAVITDQLIQIGLGLIGGMISLLPGPVSHTWLDAVAPSVVAPFFLYDSVLPIHESLTVLGIFIALSVPAFGLRLALFIYRHLPVIGKG
jgi:hypothetical protein